MAKHIDLGRQGESLALKYLQENGFTILEQNWRHLKAEVDLITVSDGMLVLVEVKTRTNDYFGMPEESINRNKQRMMCDAANAYIELKELKYEVRFDVISIISDGKEVRLNHIKDAFYPFSSELDG